MKTMKKIILAIAIFAVVIIGASSIVITQENQYSLVRQFGKIDHVVSESGISFKIPFIQSVDTLPREILLYDLSPSDVTTSDKKMMICDSYILWQITDPVKFAQTLNGSISSAESRLDAIVYNSTKILSAARLRMRSFPVGTAPYPRQSLRISAPPLTSTAFSCWTLK